jgi:hypothetical protein
MKRFASYKIFLCVVFLVFLVQVVAAEQIYIPGTAYGGVQYTAQQSGIYKFTYVSGAARGPDCQEQLWCGCCPPGQACWSGFIDIYINKVVSWGLDGSCPEVVPSGSDYVLGSGNFLTLGGAEAALGGTYVEIPLNKGDILTFTVRDYQTSYGDNTGGMTVDVQMAVIPDISGTWSGTYNTVGIEQYSTVYTITQNEDQFSGTASFVITESNYYPQDVGKSFTYSFEGTIDENGVIHIIGNVLEAPPEIYQRAGAWDLNYQLSDDGNTISYNGYVVVLLYRGAPNQPPISIAGLDQSATVNTLVTLDGTGSSDPDNNLPLTYVWSMSAPTGSTATLSSTTAANPTFTPDVAGDYNIALTVTDSLGLPSTTADTVKITVNPSTTTGTVSFDKKEYTDINSVARITVADSDLNTDPLTPQKVTVVVHSFSKTDWQEIGTETLILDETNVDSGIFSNGIGFSTIGSELGRIKVTPNTPGVFTVTYIDAADANGLTDVVNTDNAQYQFYLEVKVSTSGHFIELADGEIWADQGFVPIHVQVFKGSQPYQGATIITTDTPKGEEWAGTTDENGKMDLKYPLDTLFSDVRSLTFTVKAKGDGINGESEPIKIFDSTMKSYPREITPEIKNNFDTVRKLKYWELMCQPSIDIPYPQKYQWVGYIPSLVISLAYWSQQLEYDPAIGDKTLVETFVYTAQDTVPVYRIHEYQTRNGEVILDHNAYVEDRVTFDIATSGQILTLDGFKPAIASPAVPYVTAPDGSRAGYDPTTGLLVKEFPMAIGEPGDEPFLMYIPNPQKGDYLIDVVGTGTGPYIFSIESTNSEGLPGQPFSYSGQTTVGKIDKFITTVAQSGEISIKPANQPPLANAGPDQTVTVNTLVTLDSTVSSDPDNNLPLTYAWIIANKPSGSTATLSSITAAKPTFTPDIAGDYVFSLIVADSQGLASSTSDSVKITANVANQLPVPVKVKILPNPLNIASKGYFIAFVTLPKGYKAADVDATSVQCQGISALKLVRSKWFPQIFVGIFSREKLAGLPLGNNELTLTGIIKKNGQKVGFSGSNTIKIISKVTKTKEPIDDVMKLSDDKVFSQFNPG